MDAADEASLYSEPLVETIRQPLLVLSSDLRVRSANSAFLAHFQLRLEETVGHLVYELADGEWDIPELRTLLEQVHAGRGAIAECELEHQFRNLGRRCMLINVHKLSQDSGDDLVLLAIEDITQRREDESALRHSEQRLKDLVEALPGAVYTVSATGLITYYNPAAAELWGREPELGVEKFTGALRVQRPDGTPLPHHEVPLAIALRENRNIRGAELVAERPDGVLVPLLAYPTLLRDVSGTVTGALNMLVDITERKRAEALAQKLAAIVESSDDAIVSKNMQSVIESWNRGAEKLFGYSAEEAIGKSIAIIIPPERKDEEALILDRLRRREHIDHYETIRMRKDGSRVWVSLTISPLTNSAGKVIGASKIARDMSERRHADEQRRMLVGELGRRVKNILAVIQAIASQTLGHASAIEEARAAFGARLINLSKAHDILTRENWSGANLAEIVADTVGLHSGRENRFRIDGPHVQLASGASLAFAMALHELATNAAKYGALSSDKGRVDIVWRIEGNGDGRRLNFRWTERGGPSVEAPGRKGFGSRLIETALAQELGGEVRVLYEPSGVVCIIGAPIPEDG